MAPPFEDRFSSKFGLIASLIGASLVCFAASTSLSNLDVAVEEQDSFYFDPAPVDQDVIEGGETRLRCDVSSRKMIVFYWTLNGKPVANTSRRYQDDSDLRVVRADRVQDSGSFRCVATNVTTGIALRSTEARLNIFWVDKSAEVQVKAQRDGDEIIESTEVTMKCQADGNPEPTVEWTRNKQRLLSSERVRIHKNRLKLISVSAADNGVFECRAENLAGKVNSSNAFLLNVAGSGAAKLSAESFSPVMLVRRGGRAVFNCSYTNAVSTEWYFDQYLISAAAAGDSAGSRADRAEPQAAPGGGGGVAATASQKYSQLPNGTLIIDSVDDRDVGVYRCVGVGRSGPVQSFATQLVLAYLDDLTESSFEPRSTASRPLVVPAAGKLDIQCRLPNGLPTPTQRWLSPTGNVIGDSESRIRSFEGVLSIGGAEESDSGNYTCVAENVAGSRRHRVWVAVSVPPVISRPPLSSRVTEGDTAQFDCKVTGSQYPITLIDWITEYGPVNTDDARFRVDQMSGILSIDDVTLADEGNYACLINTTAQPVITSTNAHLYVEKRLKFKPVPTDMKLELGSSARIACRAEGRVVPTVRWYRADTGSNRLPDRVKDDAGDLVFETVGHVHAGRYMCLASSEQGTVNVTIRVDVIVKPRFKVKPVNTTVIEGHSAMLHCVATGDPLPTVHWDRNNKVNGFDTQRFKVLSNGSLVVSEVYMEDTGKYGCTVRNSGGADRAEVTLQVTSADAHLRSSGSTSDEVSTAIDSADMMKTIVIAVCSAIAYLAIVVGITVYCSIRLIRAKNLRKHGQAETARQADNSVDNGIVITENTELMSKKIPVLETPSAGNGGNGIGYRPVPNEPDARSTTTLGGLVSLRPSLNHSSSSSSGYEQLSLQRHQLQLLSVLGKGLYGDVLLAKVRSGPDADSLVMVKSLLSRCESHIVECRREIELFSRVNHNHVVHLVGLCCKMEPLYLVTEYCEWGDLKTFLRATSDDSSGNSRLPPLTVAQRVTMCGQVALGMEHIAERGLTHRDLAARNILLSPALHLKVSLPGLCRDFYASEYFDLGDGRIVPLRWMAPEVAVDSSERFWTSYADVWSFGVLVYEVFSGGQLPLGHRTDVEVLAGLGTSSNRLACPPGCPSDVWSLVEACTVDFAHRRPTFSDVVNLIYELTASTG